MGMRLSYLLVLWASPLLHEREGSIRVVIALTYAFRLCAHAPYYTYYSTDLSATADLQVHATSYFFRCFCTSSDVSVRQWQ